MRIKSRLAVIAILSVALCACLLLSRSWAADNKNQKDQTPSNLNKRTSSGLLAFYDFASSSGNIIKDRSGNGAPLDLKIIDTKAVRRSAGSLQVVGGTLIRSDKPASKITDAIRKSQQITIEVWLKPSKTNLTGPARIFTLSKHATDRNFTLGQDGNKFDVRFRTTKTSNNGLPSLSSPGKSLTTRLTHLVYTRDRLGRTRIYLNGKQHAEKTVSGNTSKWNGSFRLALANELTRDRPWQGTYYLVALYKRALSFNEVQQNFKAGPGAGVGEPGQNPLAQKMPPGQQQFETRIAPLLATHCLECHDTATKKGKLDLSRKTSAFAQRKSGKTIVPGKPDLSLLWESVESNEMPKKRPPLSAKQKKLLKQWIESGAVWSLDVIDPVIYAQDKRSDEIWVQRLTIAEYIQTVRGAVGVDISNEARKILPPDLRADGFANTAYNLTVDLKHVQAYSQLAQIIVSRMDTVKFASKFSRNRKLTDDSMRGLISKMGKWVLRGPLEEHEVVAYRGISTTVASAGGGFGEAVAYVLEAMLQSPRFIYRIELQQGDGSIQRVGDYELASRLSYIIWGGPPDEQLMRAAETGELFDRRRFEEQVKRMLQDSRAIDQSGQFIYQWLDLGRLDNLQPNKKKFPKWDPRLADDMRNETLMFFKELVWEKKRPLSDLLNARVTFLTPRLAEHYGIEPRGKTTMRYDLSKVRARGGILTQGSVLTLGGDEASMVTRGLFVLKDLLRGSVKDPPPCVDTTPTPTKSGLTQRGIAMARIANVNCGGCHSRFEPMAFGLEKFDGLGSYHEADEHGNKLRDDGEILFPGTGKPVAYQNSQQLMDLLASSDRVRESFTWKVTQFALGRPLVAADARTVRKIHESSQKGGGTYTALITAIVTSDLVQMTRTEKSP